MMKPLKIVTAGIALTALALLTWHYYPALETKISQPETASATRKEIVQDDSGKEVLYWYDPMVPNQKFDKPGKSPFMDMKLVPKYAGEENGEEAKVKIPATTQQNLAIRTAVAEITTFGEEVHAVGRIAPNERLYYSIQTRVPGFVDRLLVRAEGDPVRKNQKIAEIYSPELLSAQKEYLALLDVSGVDNIGNLIDAARTRLKLLGMNQQEIESITHTGQATTRIGVYAPVSGIVAELGVREGEQLVAGSSLMQIVDLSKVWLIAEVPERDAGLVKVGAKAEVELQSRPGQTVMGKVGYLYPTLDETSRTLRVRIELPNNQGDFLPGMYANVRLQQDANQALAIPSESVIDTGRREVVIVKEDEGFLPVEVETWRRSDGKTEVLRGLEEGDIVVSSGQFLIDSEASLSGVLDRLSHQPEVHSAHDVSTSQESSSEKLVGGTGTVKAIDLTSQEVILAHEPISEIGWPSMTMGFQVQDPELLNNIRIGDRIEFSFRIVNEGESYVIEKIKQSGMTHSRRGT